METQKLNLHYLFVHMLVYNKQQTKFSKYTIITIQTNDKENISINQLNLKKNKRTNKTVTQ